MTERTAGTEFCVSRIFEIVQSMSGQGNSITILVPTGFFAGDRQQHFTRGDPESTGVLVR